MDGGTDTSVQQLYSSGREWRTPVDEHPRSVVHAPNCGFISAASRSYVEHVCGDDDKSSITAGTNRAALRDVREREANWHPTAYTSKRAIANTSKPLSLVHADEASQSGAQQIIGGR